MVLEFSDSYLTFMGLVVLSRNVGKVNLFVIRFLEVSYVCNSCVVPVRNDFDYFVIGVFLLKFLSTGRCARGRRTTTIQAKTER